MNVYGFVNHVDLGFSHALLAHEKLAKYHQEGIINLSNSVDRIVYDLDITFGEHYGKDSIAKARKLLGVVVIGRPNVYTTRKYISRTNELLQSWR